MKLTKHAWATTVVALTVVALVWSVAGVAATGDRAAAVPNLGQGDVSFEVLELAPTADTYIHSWFPGTNYGTAWTLTLRSGDVAAPMFQFDLSGLPASPRLAIAEAKLQVFVTARTNASDISTIVYPLLRPWSGAQVTWANAQAGEPWAKPGANGPADRGEGVSPKTLSGAGMWVSYDVTTIVRGWALGGLENNGLMIKANDGAAVNYQFASMENDQATLRPMLRIVYTELPDVQPTIVPPTATPTPVPAVSVDKTGPLGPLQLDGYNTLEYTIVVRNSGAADVTNVVVTDVIPLGTELISATHSGAYVPVESLVVWNLGTLEAGQDVSLGVTLGVPAWVKQDGNVVNLARAYCTECTQLSQDFWEVPVYMGPTPTPVIMWLVEMHNRSGWAPRN